jgi:hypothetical protein
MAKKINVGGAPKRKETRTAPIQTLIEPSLQTVFNKFLSERPAGHHRRPSDFLRSHIIGILEAEKYIKKGKYL